MPLHWPTRLWIVRHGESAGNVARTVALRANATHIGIDVRDVDVPLSPLGEEQARSVGHWFGRLPAEERPEVVVTSPYRRARQTAQLISEAARLDTGVELMLDERLREKEFGVLDRLTWNGIQQVHPDQAEFRRLLGKFYYRPPSGESWCDVILRLRSALDTIALHHEGQRVLIVCHQVVVLCLRYLLENMTEEQILAIDAKGAVANCSITDYALEPTAGRGGKLALQRYNFVAPMQREGTPVTAEPQANVAAR